MGSDYSVAEEDPRVELEILDYRIETDGLRVQAV